MVSCGDLRDIDLRTDKLVKERSSELGRDAYPPSTRTANDSTGENDPRLFRKDLATRNPDAAALRYDPRLSTAEEEAAAIEKRLTSADSSEESAQVLDLAGALRQSQLTAREFLSAEEEYILAAISLLAERHLWGPRLFDDVSAGFNSAQVDGNTTTVANVVNTLTATQRLPYGGEAAIRWVYNATENLRSAATGQYQQSSRLALDASIPLLRGAGEIAQEGLIQSERSLIYAARDFEAFRRRFLVSVAKDYFALLLQRQSIENSIKQLESLQREEARKQALYDAGRVAQTEVNIARSQVLTTTDSVSSQKESYRLAVDRFKIRLGLPVEANITLARIALGELDIPLPETSPQDAVEKALDYRLDLQNRRDQLDDAKRQVRNARNRLLPDLNLSGNVALPTDADEREGGAVYEIDDATYGAAITFGLPLDRETERLALRSSLIRYEQAVREFDRFRDDLIVSVRFTERQISRARNSLLLAEENVKTNERRKQEQSLKPAEVTSQQTLETENDLLAARNARDSAITALRNAVLDYLVDTAQLRVGRDGQLIRLPGMDGVAAPITPGSPPRGASPPASNPPASLPDSPPTP